MDAQPLGGRAGPRAGGRAAAALTGGAAALGLPRYAGAVLDVVAAVPPGRVLTYGDVAELVGSGGPRQVGAVLARYGDAVAWWRVLRADGSPPPGHAARALDAYRREGTPLRAGGGRVDMAAARWEGPGPAGRA